MGRSNDYTTSNLLDYEYFPKHYKLIATDLSKQIELKNPDSKQQSNFIGRLDRNKGETMFFIIEKSGETTSPRIFTKCCNSCLILIMHKNGNSKDCKFIG